ncbi:diguanylate cyclase [Stappia sp. BW2]|uniref:PAS-domain containing protein n=1 Tax=Stappia sp. BW2 TaxID=2592622 RepID=UPI0011DEF4F1|nr:PAS-domain containing protein [Stappia sp. BW2]TYC79984.1 diguanylate cyclase [Stappia sp. BW2]
MKLAIDAVVGEAQSIMNPVKGHNEQDRLDSLASLAILNSDRLPEYDDLVETLATIFEAPSAFISIVGKDDLWFKARTGITLDDTPRSGTFCDQAILSRDVMVVPDALEDDRFRNSRLVNGPPHIRFYAGYPLSLDGTHILGVLCVVDTRPRQPSEQQLRQLRRMGTIVLGLMKSHSAQKDTQAALAEAEEQQRRAIRKRDLLEEITTVSGVGGWEFDLDTDTLTWTDKTREIHEVGSDFMPTVEMALSFYAPNCRHQISDAVVKCIRDGVPWDLELPFITAKGRKRWVRTAGRPVVENGRTTRLVGAFQDITERKRSEEAILQSEAVHRTTLETLSEGILLLNKDGKIQSSNPAAAALLGYCGADMQGRKLQDLELDILCEKETDVSGGTLLQMVAEDPERVRNVVANVSRRGVDRSTWLSLNAKPIGDQNAFGLDGVVLSLTDVSAVKRQVIALQAIFDNLPGGLVYYDPERRLAVCNRDFQRLLQLPQEFIDRKAHLVEVATYLAERGDYGPGDPGKLLEERLRHFDNPKPHIYEHVSPDGTHLEARGIPLPSGGLISSFFDISERKQAEHVLRHSEAVHRTTLETLSEGILLLTHTGDIQSANPAAVELLGFAGTDLVGLNVSDIDFGLRCSLKGKRECHAPLELASRDPGIVRDVVARLIPANGQPRRWLRLSARPVNVDQDFDLDGVVVSLTDITEAKQQADTLQSIFDNFPGGIVHYDEAYRLASSNEQFLTLLDYPQDLIDRKPSLYDFFHYNAERGDYGPGDPETLAMERYKQYDLKKPQVFERRAANGSYIETRSTPLPSGGVIHNFYDITDRKNMEEQLASNERLARHRTQELEAILANMRQGVSVFDVRGQLTLWNRQYIEIFRKPESEVREGVSLIALLQAEKERGEFDGDVQEHVMDLMIRLSAGEVVRSKFQHPDGRIISAVHAPLPDGGWIGTHEDVTLREEAAEKIRFAAHHDTLTGLANRTLFNAKLDEALTAAAYNGIAGDLMMLDLDKFKPVNDRFGHDVGDALLKSVAQRLRECVRSSDLVARLGGDEFGIILTGTGSGNAGTAEIADRIVRKLGAPFVVHDNIITVGVSVGISPITGAELDPSPVLKRADLALYEVKRNGRNGFKFFEEDGSVQFARA